MALGLTYKQQWEVLSNNPDNLVQKIEMKSVQYAAYLMGLNYDSVKFGGKKEVYDRMMTLCRRILLAQANNDSKVFLSIAQTWIVDAQAEIDFENLSGTITDALINWHIEADVLKKVAGVSGYEYYGEPA